MRLVGAPGAGLASSTSFQLVKIRLTTFLSKLREFRFTYFPLPVSCGTMQVAVPVTSLPARSCAVTVR